MKRIIITLLSIIALNCYSQETWTMQIWKKDGSKVQYNTEEIDSVTFALKMDYGAWEERMSCPTNADINLINRTSNCRSPYITAWLDTGIEGGFSAYSIDFKADYLPEQTYCSLATFRFDYMNSSLHEEYDSINNGKNYSCYAGFQRINKPDLPKYNGIISIWETYCYKDGKIDTLRAELVEPNGKNAIYGTNEGNYVSYHPEYPWKPGKWYRMLVRFAEPATEQGNTKLEYRVCDLETKEWEKLCVFDMGTRNLQFQGKTDNATGKTAVFLEDWLTETAGEVRTLEFKNVCIYSNKQSKWVNANKAYFSDRDNHDNICYSGSYQYGADESIFWMITTGVSNCAANPKPITLTVENSEEGDPEIIN